MRLLCFLVLLILFQSTHEQSKRSRVDNGRTKADVNRLGGKVSVTPTNTDDEGVDMEVEEVAEVDVDGNKIRKGRRRHHSFDRFDELTFEASQPSDVEFGGLRWRAINLTATLPNGTAVIKVQILNALEAGEIEIQGELQAISEGFIKFNIIINDWEFCEGVDDDDDCGALPGEGLLMKLRMRGKGKARGKKLMKKADHESMRGTTKLRERPRNGKAKRSKRATRPSRPSGGTGPSRPSGGTGSSSPSGGTGSSSPSGGTGSSSPSGGTGSSSPSGGTGSSRPSSGTGPSRPSDGTGPSRPSGGTGSSRPSDGNRPTGPSNGNPPAGPSDGSRPTGPSNGNPPVVPSDGSRPTGPSNGNRPAGPSNGNRPAGPSNGNRPAGPSNGNRPAGRPGGDDTIPGTRIRAKLGGKRWSHIIPDDLRGKEDKTLPDVYGFGSSDDYDDSYVVFSRMMTVDEDGREMDPDFPKTETDGEGSVVWLKFDRFNRTLFYDPTFIIPGAADVSSNDGSSTTSAASSPIFNRLISVLFIAIYALV